MSFAENLLKLDPVTGIAVGVGAVVLWPFVSPVARPVAKAIVKAGLVLYDAGATASAAVGELIAEAQTEAAQNIPHESRRRMSPPKSP